mmetsp:Transcript_13887/g.23024  ORF Transcript_13887/g.23024 Transcript_13887/m.23024 type:complete len:257 (+) Transcript_13887:35-805(+)
MTATAQETQDILLIRAPGTITGYKGVRKNSSTTHPFKSEAWSKERRAYVSLGVWSTAEEAALAYAHHLGPDASVTKAAHVNAKEEARKACAAEMRNSSEAAFAVESQRCTKTGYTGVSRTKSRSKPYRAALPGGRTTRQYLGSFASAEEAALARATALSMGMASIPTERFSLLSREEQNMSAAEVEQLAESEGLQLIKATTKSGFKNVVRHNLKEGRVTFEAFIQCGVSKKLGRYATAQHAALAIARYCRGDSAAA